MAVVPITQLALIRSKRQLRTALQQRDWHGIKSVDLQMGVQLESATTDPHKDHRDLLLELREILGLYGGVVEACRQEVTALAVEAGLGDDCRSPGVKPCDSGNFLPVKCLCSRQGGATPRSAARPTAENTQPATV